MKGRRGAGGMVRISWRRLNSQISAAPGIVSHRIVVEGPVKPSGISVSGARM